MRPGALREVAGRQHGVVLTSDLRGLGISRVELRTLKRQGWLVELQRGAYLLGGAPPSAWQQLVAAWLLGGPSAVVSHASAGRIHHLFGMVPASGSGSGAGVGEPVELIVVRPFRHRPPGSVVHRYRELPPDHVVEYRGVRVTTPARTLVDLLPRLSPMVVEKTVDEGTIARLWTPADLQRLAEASAGRPGVDVLRALVAARAGAGRSDSPLEVRVARALAAFGPFETQFQVVVDGRVFILDIAWPGYRVAAECEGWEVRSRSRSKFDHERRRDNLLAAHGWTVVRLTSAMSDDEIRAAVFKVLLRAAATG
jgi:very-short-patch-repair endonuclease